MLDKLKNIFGLGTKTQEPRLNSPSENTSKPKKSRKPKEKKVELSAKEIATQKGEPYINITRVDIDPNNINNGAFELDWNDKFLLNLVRAGYKKSDNDTDNEIVDRWFQSVCRNIALEMYEQEMADPEKRRNDMVRVVSQRDLGNGRTEIS
jgi:hypothetical protein